MYKIYLTLEDEEGQKVERVLQLEHERIESMDSDGVNAEIQSMLDTLNRADASNGNLSECCNYPIVNGLCFKCHEHAN